MPDMRQHTQDFPAGIGLGLRRDFIEEVVSRPHVAVDFFEVAPENWIGVGGRQGRLFRAVTERHLVVCHGLSLDLGGPRPLDFELLDEMKTFFRTHSIRHYSEHLSYCADTQGHLYDLMPMPFTESAVRHLARRIRTVQEILEMPIAVENISFYAVPDGELDEAEFIRAVLEEADCLLLLDVNNVYVNAFNHDLYEPERFISAMPSERIAYLHLAGHWDQEGDLKIDTHGEPIPDAVWSLYRHTLDLHGIRPTLIERDFDIPPLDRLLAEVSHARTLQTEAAA